MHDPGRIHSLLNTWIQDLVLQDAPKSFIEALGFLLDDDIAHQALVVLESADTNSTG